MKHSVRKCFSFGTAPFTGRQMMSPSTRSNDTMSGISSLAPSKHSSSSHSLASVSFILFFFFCCHVCFIFDLFFFKFFFTIFGCICVWMLISGLDASPKLSKSVCQSIHTLGGRACGGRVRGGRGR